MARKKITYLFLVGAILGGVLVNYNTCTQSVRIAGIDPDAEGDIKSVRIAGIDPDAEGDIKSVRIAGIDPDAEGDIKSV